MERCCFFLLFNHCCLVYNKSFFHLLIIINLQNFNWLLILSIGKLWNVYNNCLILCFLLSLLLIAIVACLEQFPISWTWGVGFLTSASPESRASYHDQLSQLPSFVATNDKLKYYGLYLCNDSIILETSHRPPQPSMHIDHVPPWFHKRYGETNPCRPK